MGNTSAQVGAGAYVMCEHFDCRSGHVGGPHGDHPLRMPQQADCIMGVLTQHITGPHLASVLSYDLACAGVLRVIAPDGRGVWNARVQGRACIV